MPANGPNADGRDADGRDADGRVVTFVERRLAALTRQSMAHPWIALGAVVLFLALSLGGAARLRLDPDLTHLLPRSFPSVKALDALQERFGSVGFVVVVGQGAEPADLRRFARELAPRLERLADIQYVDWRRPSAFFRDHALYYLDLPELESVHDQLRIRERWERLHRNPLVVDLEESTPPPLDFTGLRARYRQRAEGRLYQPSSPAAGAYYLDVQRRMVVLLARPTHRASDLGFAEKLVTRVQAAIATVDVRRYGPDFRIALTGRYVKKLDQKRQIAADLKVASLLALALVLLYLGWHFRRPAAVALLLVPLLVGLLWTFGLAGALFGTINLLSGFVGAILVGLGIDHGIHLLGRYDAERAAGRSLHEAAEQAFGRTGRASVVAGLTTAVAFFGLAFSEFGAFREFGIIAATGTVLIVIAYVICLPALLALTARWARPPAAPATVPGSYVRALPRWAPLFFWLGVLVATGIAAQSRKVTFDYDFASLEDSTLPAFRLDKHVNRLLGHSQTPIVVLTGDARREQSVVAALRAAQRAHGEATSIDFVASVSDLIPSGQHAKQRVLSALGELLEDVSLEHLDGDERARVVEARRLARALPFGRADLPAQVRRQFRGPHDPVDAGLVLVFPRVSLSDGPAVVRLAAEVRAVVRAPVAGEAMVMADILSMVRRDAPAVLALTLMLGFVLLWLLLGELRVALLCFAASLLGLGVTLGLLSWVGLQLNYLNIVVIPVLFGLGVDGAVHMVTRLRGSASPAVALRETGQAVAGALLTTAFGFGVLMLADHPGLQAFGAFAVLGLAVNLLVSVVLVPALLLLLLHAEPARKTLAGLFSTVGLAGSSPVAPGTLGALVAIPFGWLLWRTPPAVHAGVIVLLTVLGILAIDRYVEGRRDADPQEVVIDEFVGCLLTMAFVPPSWPWVLAAFLLFRLFDIVKPWPIRRIHHWHRAGLSVMGDDIAAGAMAGVLLWTAQWVLR